MPSTSATHCCGSRPEHNSEASHLWWRGLGAAVGARRLETSDVVLGVGTHLIDDLVLEQIGRFPAAVPAGWGAHVDTAAASASGAAAQLTLRAASR